MTAERMACHDVVDRLPWLLNGSLTDAEQRSVRGHLERCPSCRGELRATHRALAVAAGHVPAEDLADFGFDDVPSAARRAEIAGHVARCPECATELEQVRASRAVHDAEAAGAPAGAAGSRPRRIPLAWAAATAAAVTAVGSLALWRSADTRAEHWQREAESLADRLRTVTPTVPDAPPATAGRTAPAPAAEPAPPEPAPRPPIVQSPRVNVAVFELRPRDGLRLRSQPAADIPLNVVEWTGEEMVTFLLLAPPQPDGGPHAVALLDSAGRVVWRGEGLRARPGGDFALALPASRLPDAFTLRVERRGAEPLVYPVRVARR